MATRCSPYATRASTTSSTPGKLVTKYPTNIGTQYTAARHTWTTTAPYLLTFSVTIFCASPQPAHAHSRHHYHDPLPSSPNTTTTTNTTTRSRGGGCEIWEIDEDSDTCQFCACPFCVRDTDGKWAASAGGDVTWTEGGIDDVSAITGEPVQVWRGFQTENNNPVELAVAVNSPEGNYPVR